MFWKIEIRNKEGIFDAVGEGIKKDILDLNVSGVESVRLIEVYIIDGKITEAQVKRICAELLADPITQEYRYRGSFVDAVAGLHIVEICYKPGVMDPVEESTRKGIRDLGITGVNSVKTAKKFVLSGEITDEKVALISEKLLYNKVIQHISDTKVETADLKIQKGEVVPRKFELVNVGIIGAGDEQLMKLSRQGQLFLNQHEMAAIRDYFTKLGRNPTDCELETIAQTWSEHCKHKTLRGIIEYQEETDAGKLKMRSFDNLLKETIMKVTKELKKSWCISVFKDNAGVIRFDNDYHVCFKVETHNHPSALEPYGGAGTGIGGVILSLIHI